MKIETPKVPGPIRRQSVWANLALAILSSALFLGVLEGGARWLEPPAPEIADYLWNWQREWDGDFYIMRSDSAGWPQSEFNADGMRDRAHALEKPAGVFRVAVLGDSVTLGAGLDPARAYPQVLQSQLDAAGRFVEVSSVALWGWSTRQERIAYERIARRYHPDQVVLGICLNDIAELQNNLAQPPAWLTSLHERSALVRLAVNARGREIGRVEELFDKPGSPKVREALGRLFAELRLLRDSVARDGAGFAILVLPFRFQLGPQAPPPSVQQAILGFCREERIRCFDMLPVLRGERDPFLDYDHLNRSGNRRVAQEIIAQGVLLDGPAAPARLGIADLAAISPELAASLRDRLRSGSTAERQAAAWALGRLPEPAPVTVVALSAALADADEPVRAEAAVALGRIGRPAQAALPALFEALADPRQAVRWRAAEAIDVLHAVTVSDVPALVLAVRSPDSYVRAFAAWTLGGLGPGASAAVPALMEALANEEGYSRGGAASALAKIGAAAAQAVPALLEGLAAADGEKRWKAARALGRIGAQAEAAVPALVRALADPHELVRAHACRALGRIGGSTAEPALQRALADADPGVRREAQAALEHLAGR